MTLSTNSEKKLRAFIAFAEPEARMKQQFRAHLRALREYISLWDINELIAGDMCEQRVVEEINQADIIFLLTSSSFLDNDFIEQVVIKNAWERHNKGEAIVIPIRLRPYYLETSTFGQLLAIPRHPISCYKEKDMGWVEVIGEIKRLIVNFNNNKNNMGIC